MIGRIAELHVDRGDPLEVMADIQFVAHAHAAMKLDGLLGDKARGIADLRFRAGRQFRTVRLSGREAQVQVLHKRDRLFKRDEHVDHAVLQHLKRAERDTELLARLGVFERHRIQFAHRPDGFGAQRRDSRGRGRLPAR